MARVWLIALIVLGSAACGPKLIVPNTPEGLACWRQCQQTYYSCKASYRPPTDDVGATLAFLSGDPCYQAQQSCLTTCPGAHWETQGRSSASASVVSPGNAPTDADRSSALLRVIDGAYSRGQISKEEYDRQRDVILNGAVR